MRYDCIVLTYDAPHRKTYDTLCLLKVRGYADVLVWAVPMHYKKKFKPIYEHRPQTYDYMKPEILAKQFGYTYYRADSFDEFGFDYSIPVLICGAGIIPNNVIRNYNVINAHPGYIPLVRGLDALKWAIVDERPIGVTTHLLGDEIDAGEIIDRKIIEIHSNDTFHSIAQKVYEIEIVMLVDAIEMLTSEHVYMPAGDNTLHKRMPAEIEKNLLSKFEEYKRTGAKEGA